MNKKEYVKRWNKLVLHLGISNLTMPNLLYTFNKEKWNKLTGNEDYNVSCLYNEDINTIIFNTKRFDKIIKLEDDIIYISDEFIYHEMIHAIQFQCGSWLDIYNSFIEGTAELYCNIISSNKKLNIDLLYKHNCIFVWDISRNILKHDIVSFYIFVRDFITNCGFYSKYINSVNNIRQLILDYHLDDYKIKDINKKYIQMKKDLILLKDLIL